MLSVVTGVLKKRGEDTETQGRRPCEETSREWDDVTNQGTPGTTRKEARKDLPLGPLEAVWPCEPLGWPRNPGGLHNCGRLHFHG